VMPTMVDDVDLRDPLRELLREQRVQTSVLYPAIHEFSAYRRSHRPALPRSERAARTQLTLPLYPHLSHDDQDRVVAAVEAGLAELVGTGDRRGATISA
jgi:dTDP-4-amino-4,6-dideoxygalactose transaminase